MKIAPSIKPHECRKCNRPGVTIGLYCRECLTKAESEWAVQAKAKEIPRPAEAR